ncbi:hypothetical protein GCM10009641_47250 [Mycobacterium cookii]|uniref:Uncharacterized protein n=1 Tax=Mycobacterium cookii TaxID=1775 RepID=A0A7I7KXB1_9MYCO|nr:hypothetical protein MCOO_21530 [Mycobacterium cookii]
MAFMQIPGLSAHFAGAMLQAEVKLGVASSPACYASSPDRLFSDVARARLDRPDRGVPPPRSGPHTGHLLSGRRERRSDGGGR